MSRSMEIACDADKFPEFPKCRRQILLEEELCLPEAKPDIEDVVEFKVQARIEEFKVIRTPIGLKVVIRGEVDQQIMYVADVPSQSVHATHSTTPFCTFIQLPHRRNDPYHADIPDPKVLVEYANVQADGPRRFLKCVLLFVWMPGARHHDDCSDEC